MVKTILAAITATVLLASSAAPSSAQYRYRGGWLIPLSQVNQNLVLVGQIRNGPGFEFFGRSWSVCPHAGRSPSAPRLAPDCRHAFAGIVAPDDVPVTRRVMVRGEPEHGFERDVPVEAPIVSEDKLIGYVSMCLRRSP